MSKLTKNIWQHELDCRCGNCNVTIEKHEPVIGIVQGACDYFAVKYGVDKVTLVISSAARCYEHNRLPREQGGAGSNDNSQHPRCRAIDFKLFLPDGTPIDPKEVWQYLNEKHPSSLGLGSYIAFTHVDTRPFRARW